METGYPKEEIQNDFEVVDLDLLIIDYVAIYPKYRGLNIAESAIHRTIGIFGIGCGLAACKPRPLQSTSVRCGRSRRVEKTCAAQRWQSRGRSETEIVLVTARILAAWQHRNISAERISKGL